MVVLTREQIEERLVALHRASLELVSNLSLETVLERIVCLAREQAGARYAALGVFAENSSNDGAAPGFEFFIPVGMSDEEKQSIPHLPEGKGLLDPNKWGRKTIRLADLSKSPHSVGFPKNHPAMKSFLGVPIVQGNTLLGQLYLTDKISHTEFTEDDEQVIETLAAYAAVAISNARLYEDLQEQDRVLNQRNEDLSLLNDIASALTGSLELDDILEQTLNRVIAYLGMDAGEIFLSEESGTELRLAMHRGKFPQAFWSKDRFHYGEGVVGTVAETGKAFVTSSLREETIFLRTAVVESGFQCLASIPLLAHSNVVGVMNVVSRQEHTFDDRQISLLSSIGSWAGITIENARLHRQARRLAVLEERERIGMDLHDGIIQSIYAVGLALDFARVAIDDDPNQACDKIEQAIEGLNSAIGDIRSYIADLRPRQLGGKNLMEGLQRLVDEYKSNTRSSATLTGPQDGLAALPVTRATALFHICQEALANIAKHAHASQAHVHLWATKERVLLEVSDNGQGFDEERANASLGHGLSNMSTRAQKVGGDVEITSEPGEGTTVLAWVPLRE